LVSLLLTSGVASAANVRLQVEGLTGALQKNVRAQLSTIESDEVTPDRRFRARVDDAIREGLKALGYYEPTIDFDLRPPPAKGRQVLIARVSPGEPVKIGGTDVVLRGGARDDKDYIKLLHDRPAIGTVLNHSDYEGFKKDLTRVALRKGYFDSQFNKSQLGISLDRHQAFWDIDYDSGQRYRFGDVTFEGSQIRDEYLQNLIPFKEGDYYRSSDLAELNRRLSATGWFNSVVVAPEFDKARQTKVLPLHGVVSPRTENTIETGVGYSTDVGPRVKATWKKPWMNSYGHSLTTSASISAPEQQSGLGQHHANALSALNQLYHQRRAADHVDQVAGVIRRVGNAGNRQIDPLPGKQLQGAQFIAGAGNSDRFIQRIAAQQLKLTQRGGAVKCDGRENPEPLPPRP
jgi:translocation and assembly module TamA